MAMLLLSKCFTNLKYGLYPPTCNRDSRVFGLVTVDRAYLMFSWFFSIERFLPTTHQNFFLRTRSADWFLDIPLPPWFFFLSSIFFLHSFWNLSSSMFFSVHSCWCKKIYEFRMISLGNSLLVIKSKDGMKWKPLSRFIYKTKSIWKATAVQFNVKVKHYFQNGFFFIFTDSKCSSGSKGSSWMGMLSSYGGKFKRSLPKYL